MTIAARTQRLLDCINELKEVVARKDAEIAKLQQPAKVVVELADSGGIEMIHADPDSASRIHVLVVDYNHAAVYQEHVWSRTVGHMTDKATAIASMAKTETKRAEGAEAIKYWKDK